jgi:hypothetical protein
MASMFMTPMSLRLTSALDRFGDVGFSSMMSFQLRLFLSLNSFTAPQSHNCTATVKTTPV